MALADLQKSNIAAFDEISASNGEGNNIACGYVAAGTVSVAASPHKQQ